MEFKDLKIGDDVTFLHWTLEKCYLSWDWEECRGVIIEQLSETVYLVALDSGKHQILTTKDEIIKIHNNEI